MLLKSSSTPILGSLLSSSAPHFNESPNHHHHHHHHHHQISEKPPSLSHPPKPSLHCHLSSISAPSPTHDPPPSSSSSTLGFRRAQSDGNLHSLLPPSDRRTHPPQLDSIPSFSIPNSRGREEEDGEGGEEKGLFDGGFSFMGENQNLSLMENSGSCRVPLFLARGLGIDRVGSGLLDAGGNCGGGRGAGGGGGGRNGSGGERSDIEMYYRKMVEENPSNALFLCNYAQFLYKSKGDVQRAEEYYSRAILAEPGDGEILSQYAKLVWELHHDKERASSYFEQAVRACPNNSNVLGAYAGFLWETEDDDGDEGGEYDQKPQEYFGATVRHEILA